MPTGKKLQPNIDLADGRRLQKESLEDMTKRTAEEKETYQKYNEQNQSKRQEQGPRKTPH